MDDRRERDMGSLISVAFYLVRGICFMFCEQ